MNNNDLLRHKDLLLSMRRDLATGKNLADSISTAGELHADAVLMAPGKTTPHANPITLN